MRLLFFFLFLICSPNQNYDLTSWLGDYSYNEEPAKAIAEYNMMMSWSLSINNENDDFKGKLEIEGQQTYVKMDVKILGDENRIKVIFQNTSDGFGFEQLKRGDTLFLLSQKNNQLTTTWDKLHPLLIENFKNNTVNFIKE